MSEPSDSIQGMVFPIRYRSRKRYSVRLLIPSKRAVRSLLLWADGSILRTRSFLSLKNTGKRTEVIRSVSAFPHNFRWKIVH